MLLYQGKQLCASKDTVFLFFCVRQCTVDCSVLAVLFFCVRQCTVVLGQAIVCFKRHCFSVFLCKIVYRRLQCTSRFVFLCTIVYRSTRASNCVLQKTLFFCVRQCTVVYFRLQCTSLFVFLCTIVYCSSTLEKQNGLVQFILFSLFSLVNGYDRVLQQYTTVVHYCSKKQWCLKRTRARSCVRGQEIVHQGKKLCT